MRIVEDGDSFSVYTKFKAYAAGVSADLLWEESGGKLLVVTCHEGHRAIWRTSLAAEKTQFHADFPNAYEVA